VLKIFYFVLRNYKSVFLLDVLILGSVLKHLANRSIELDRTGVGKEWEFRNCAKGMGLYEDRGLSSHCSNLQSCSTDLSKSYEQGSRKYYLQAKFGTK
jgi:hypothetical protein